MQDYGSQIILEVIKMRSRTGGEPKENRGAEIVLRKPWAFIFTFGQRDHGMLRSSESQGLLHKHEPGVYRSKLMQAYSSEDNRDLHLHM